MDSTGFTLDFARWTDTPIAKVDWNNCLLVICWSTTWDCYCVGKALWLDKLSLRTAVSKEYGRPDLSCGHGLEACQMSIASVKIVFEE